MLNSDELGAGKNPVPEEREMKEINGTIVVEYKFSLECLKSSTREDIISEIKENLSDYISNGNLVDIDF